MAIELSEKQIKDGWQIVKFGEIAKEVKSTTKDPAGEGLEFYVGLDHLDPQSLRIARKGIIAEDNPSFTRRFSAGQILFGKRRCYQKKAAVADFEGICSGDIIVMDAIPKKIIPGLLPFIIQSDAFFDWAEKTSSGSLSPRTKWKSLAEFEFPLPPIERQKEILEVLEKLEDTQTKNIETIYSSKLAKKVLMRDMLTGTKRAKGFTEKWRKSKIGDICIISRGGSPRPINKYITEDPDGLNWLKIGDIDSEAKFINRTTEKIKKSGLSKTRLIPKGSFILSNSMSFGRPYILNIDTCIHDGWLSLHDIDENVDKDFLYYLFLTPYVQNQFASYAAGSGVKNLNKEIVSNCDTMLPSLSEQQYIAKFLSVIDAEVELLEKKEKILQAQKQALTIKLLFGGVQ